MTQVVGHPNWREVITTTLRSRRGRLLFDYPPNFGERVYSKILWEADRSTAVEKISAEIKAMEVHLNGLFIDGDGI